MANKGTFLTLNGADVLLKEMKAFGPTVAEKATVTGLRKASRLLAKEFKRSVPNSTGRSTGRLRRQIKYKVSRRAKKAWVGLRKGRGETNILYYYKTLEFGRDGGPPLAPFMALAWNDVRASAADLIIEETRKALYVEAGCAAELILQHGVEGAVHQLKENGVYALSTEIGADDWPWIEQAPSHSVDAAKALLKPLGRILTEIGAERLKRLQARMDRMSPGDKIEFSLG